MRILPPTFFVMLLGSSLIIHMLWPIGEIISNPYNYMGIVLVLIGFFLNLWADLLFSRAHTNEREDKDPQVLITHGPYRITRNPMHLGAVIFFVGVAFVLGTWIAFIFPLLCFIVLDKYYIKYEEKELKKVFGKSFLAYKKRVRRWI